MTLPFLFQDQSLFVYRIRWSQACLNMHMLKPYGLSKLQLLCELLMDIRPKKGCCRCIERLFIWEKTVANICDLFLLWRNIQTCWITSRQDCYETDAKTTEIVNHINGNTRRFILHTSTVTCLDRDLSLDTRFMYRSSYVPQLWDFEISSWLLKLLTHNHLLLHCSQIILERSIDTKTNLIEKETSRIQTW